ncbi:MAG: GNAT family N-acetyltransferase [Alphaproteobacteria bacterium]
MNPRLETPRLVLRPVTLADAPDVQRLVGDWAVARTLARVPHPYTDGMAEEWIESLAGGFASGTAFVFALEPRSDTGPSSVSSASSAAPTASMSLVIGWGGPIGAGAT